MTPLEPEDDAEFLDRLAEREEEARWRTFVRQCKEFARENPEGEVGVLRAIADAFQELGQELAEKKHHRDAG